MELGRWAATDPRREAAESEQPLVGVGVGVGWETWVWPHWLGFLAPTSSPGLARWELAQDSPPECSLEGTKVEEGRPLRPLGCLLLGGQDLGLTEI